MSNQDFTAPLGRPVPGVQADPAHLVGMESPPVTGPVVKTRVNTVCAPLRARALADLLLPEGRVLTSVPGGRRDRAS